MYPKYLKKNIDVEKSTIFSCHDLPGFPMAKIHITYTPRRCERLAVPGWWPSRTSATPPGWSRPCDSDFGARGLRRSEGMQIGVISLGIGPLVGRFREYFRDFIGDFDEMIEMS